MPFSFLKTCLHALLLLGLFSPAAVAQDSTVRYYRDAYGEKETNAAAARFAITNTVDANGRTSHVVENLRKGKVVSQQIFIGEEPWGYWIEGDEKQDYNFPLTYTAAPCTEPVALENLTDYFTSVPALGYTAPTLLDEKSPNFFLANNVRYPAKAREAGVDGRVVLSFRITEKGEVEGVSVRIGTNIHLDKEAMRVVRKMKFSKPPLLNGKPVSVCASLPIKFTLE